MTHEFKNCLLTSKIPRVAVCVLFRAICRGGCNFSDIYTIMIEDFTLDTINTVFMEGLDHEFFRLQRDTTFSDTSFDEFLDMYEEAVQDMEVGAVLLTSVDDHIRTRVRGHTPSVPPHRPHTVIPQFLMESQVLLLASYTTALKEFAYLGQGWDGGVVLFSHMPRLRSKQTAVVVINRHLASLRAEHTLTEHCLAMRSCIHDLQQQMLSEEKLYIDGLNAMVAAHEEKSVSLSATAAARDVEEMASKSAAEDAYKELRSARFRYDRDSWVESAFLEAAEDADHLAASYRAAAAAMTREKESGAAAVIARLAASTATSIATKAADEALYKLDDFFAEIAGVRNDTHRRRR